MQEYRPLMDWKVVAAAPLVIENQLPVKGTYLIWETPRVSMSVIGLLSNNQLNNFPCQSNFCSPCQNRLTVIATRYNMPQHLLQIFHLYAELLARLVRVKALYSDTPKCQNLL